MITENDLHGAIAECQGVRNPNANTCIKLASYYTILDHMSKTPDVVPQYSYDTGPVHTFHLMGDSEFLRLVEGKDIEGVMHAVDEMMDCVHAVMPRLYDGVMRKLKEVG